MRIAALFEPSSTRAVTPAAYQRIVAVTLAALVLIVFTGGLVRLTGSGLGCTDWPTCQDGEIVAPSGDTPAWIEFGNRLLSGAVAAPVLLSVAAARWRRPFRGDLVRWAWGLVGGVAAQVLLGGVTVRMELSPPIVAAHFVLSMVLVANATVLLSRAGHDGLPTAPRADAPTHRLSLALVPLAAVVVLTGTVVTGTGPHGGDLDAPRYDLSITTVARLHSVTMWCLLALLVVVSVRLLRRGAGPEVRRAVLLTLVAVSAQGALGYTQYALGVPTELVALHLVGATAVLASVVWLALSLDGHGPRELPPSSAVSA